MNRPKLFAVTAALALMIAACGSDAETTTTGGATTTSGTNQTTNATTDEGLPLIDPLEVSGDIVTAGSSTVFPLTEAVAAQFEEDGYGGQITIDSVGTGAGFERFCEAGETDISNASRAINEEEIALCEAIGRSPIEFRVGTDALAIVVSPSNYFVDNLTIEQLAVAFSTAATWADVDPGFPPHPIARFSPGTDSGTFDYFVEVIFDEDPEPLLAASNLQLSEDDNVLVQGVEGDTCTEGDPTTSCAIGYFGYAYYSENSGALSIASVEGVEASADNVGNGTYPLARPLFIYSDAGIMAEKSQVASFIAYYLDVVNDVIADVGYFPAPEADLQSSIEAWIEAAGT
ncbi:MAG TPA: PstS family phosphate ABC transporter substrate-binding protein [Acidimicrobiia bacterium]|nr:PstS family phosphate ABC transporter substrate-binding protein [Acidimicrobiia bacterium]